MRKTCLTLFFIAFFHFTNGQSVEILNMESALNNLTGTAYIEQLYLLSTKYTDEGLYSQALTSAKEGQLESEKLNDERRLAMGYNREAYAIYKDFGNGSRRISDANKLIRKSQSLIRNLKAPTVKKENLKVLRDLASLTDRHEDVNKLDRQILNMEKVKRKPVTKDRLLDIKEQVIDSITKMEASNEALRISLERKNDEEHQMKIKLDEYSQSIDTLTAEQIKLELLNSQMSLVMAQDSIKLQNAEMELKQADSDRQLAKLQRNFLLAMLGLGLLLALGILLRYVGARRHNQELEQKNEIIAGEKRKTEELLLNILPGPVAKELQEKGAAEARKFEKASVLFTDFKNFSRISENMSAEELVKKLDYCFRAFDEIVGKYNLEKIKTIGDSYMCAGGLPIKDDNNVWKTVSAALEMQEFLQIWKLEKFSKNEPFFEARIGVHTGPLVAGVVGVKKFAYDIWGDTVNIASRMESSGEVGKVNISGNTYELVKDKFEFEYRGKVPIKNKDAIDMYFVESSK